MRAYRAFQEPSLVARGEPSGTARLATAPGEPIADEGRLNDGIDILQLDNSL